MPGQPSIFAYILDVRNKSVTGLKNLKSEFRDTERVGQSAFSNIGKSIKATRSNMTSLLGTVTSLKSIIILTFAYRAIQRFGKFIKSLTDAYDVQERSIRLLNEGLASSGQYTSNLSSEMQELASTLQKSHAISDNLTISQMALLSTYEMEAKQIREVIPLIIDLAAAKQMDLKTATDLVGKAYVGYTGTLSRYGIILDSTLTNEEKFIQLKKQLAQYTGTAEALAKTYAGQVAKLGFAYSDMKEPIGKSIEDMIVQAGILESINKSVESSVGWFNKWKPIITETGEAALRASKEGFGYLAYFLSKIATSDIVMVIFKSLGGLLKGFLGLGKVFFNYIEGGIKNISGMIVLLDIALKETAADLAGDEESRMAFTKQWYEEAERLGIESEARRQKAFENDKKYLDGNLETWNDIAEAMKSGLDIEGPNVYKEWVEELEVLNEELRKLGTQEEDNTRNREKSNDEIERTIELTRTQAQQYALATDLEQEQIKFLMDKLGTMPFKDVGNLTELEKKMISRFSMLQEAGSEVLSMFAAYETGVESEFLKKDESKIIIELTEDAKKLIKASIIDRQVERDRRRRAADEGR